MTEEESTPIGRPTDYTEELATEICMRLMDGESLRNICKDEHMPNKSTVFRWLEKEGHPFATKYARAREIQCEEFVDELIEIADDASLDELPGLIEGTTVLNRDNIHRSKLRIETRQWVASKLLPKKYGSFKAVELSGEVKSNIQDLSHLSFEQLYELKHGKRP